MQLLEGKTQWGVFGLLLLAMFALSLFVRYGHYDSYIQKDKQTIQAKVIAQYKKNSYWVLKLKTSQSMVLYTTTKESIKNLSNKEILLYGKPKECSFIQSLRSCFFISFSIALLPSNPITSSLYHFVESQHQYSLLSQLYQSLFFGSFLPKEWREITNTLQIAHLFAISGLHLGILAGVIYWLFGIPYSWLQRRFFTYRNKIFDLGVFCSLVLLGYLFLLDFQPAFLRSYVMSVLAFAFLYSHIKILSFKFLLVCVGVILAFFPHFLLSIGFWLSVSGVYFIYLFLHHYPTKNLKTWKETLKFTFLLNSILFFNMLPLSHLFFPIFSFYSLLAIPLSILFPPFFVCVIGLHLFGFGGILDEYLIKLFDISFRIYEFSTPHWFAIIYICISLLAMRYKNAYWLSIGLGVAMFACMGLKFNLEG